jgi:hypothetical protein
VTQTRAAVLSAALGVLAFAHLATAAIVIVFALGPCVVERFPSPAQRALVSSLVKPRDLAPRSRSTR